jgi:hypothetical protein
MKKLLAAALVLTGCLNTRTENLSGRDRPLIRLCVGNTVHMSGAAALFTDVAAVKTRDVAEVQTKTLTGWY